MPSSKRSSVITATLLYLLLLAISPSRGENNTFFVTNLCQDQAYVSLDMGGHNLMFANKFTLGAGFTGTIPVEGDVPLVGTIYNGNTLPSPLAEFQLNYGHGDTHFYRIGLRDGFNKNGIEIAPTDPRCKTIKCKISMEQCPEASKKEQTCRPNPETFPEYLEAVRRACPSVFRHHTKEMFYSCPSSSNYIITFCPA